MRIIAGKYRGRKLKSPPSLDTRPTSDRLRETLFNIIAPLITDARFLDLCAGSGAVGIEALSRAAAHATFVDNSRKLGHLIRANLDLCRIGADEAEVVIADAVEFLRRGARRKSEAWKLIFFDPPYAGDYLGVLQLLAANASELMDEDGLLVVEHYHKNCLPEAIGCLRRHRLLKQGDSMLSFYGKEESA